jgi:hypothetical protein
MITELLNDYPGLSVLRRTKINTEVLSHPERAYILSGPSDTGKTRLAKELYKLYPVENRYAMSAENWQQDITDASCNRGNWPVMSAHHLLEAGGDYWGQRALFLDDIDKIRLTESGFVEPQLKAFLDAVERRGDLLNITTSLNKEDLFKKFSDQIGRRILHGRIWVDFTNK